MEKSGRLYSKSPTIGKDKDGKATLNKTGVKPADGENMGVKSNTGDMEIHHSHERREMTHKHVKEHLDMHHRHEMEHAVHKGDKHELHAKHEEELKSMHDRQMQEAQEMHSRQAPATEMTSEGGMNNEGGSV